MTTFADTLVLKDKVTGTLRNITANLYKMNRTLAKSDDAIKKYQQRTEKLKGVASKITDVGKGLTVGLTLPILAAGGAMVKLASDLEETLNKVDVSFGKDAQTVREWAKSSVKNMGLAQQSALDSAALFGDMGTGMGLATGEASKMAMNLTQLSADLASFKNISQDVAKTALAAVYTGETESLKRLGVVMTEANLQEFAYANNIRKKVRDMTQVEKIQLRYNYVLSKTNNAQGDFVRTGGGAANQARMFQESLKELGAVFGQYILPYFTKVVSKMNDMIKYFVALPEPVKKTILVMGVILSVVGPLVGVIGGLASAIIAVNGAMLLLSANPIVLTIMGIVAAIAALVAIVFVAIKGFQKLFGWIKKTRAEKAGALADDVNTGSVLYQGGQSRQSNTTNNTFNNTITQNATIREEADINKLGLSLTNSLSNISVPQGAY